jgi:uncharacterized protein
MKKTKSNAVKNNSPEGWGYETAMNFTGNPLTGVFEGMPGGYGNDTAALGSSLNLAYNSSYVFISMNRVLLTYAYVIHGVLRTLVDQPVYDSFRGGVKFKSDELDEDDIKALNEYMRDSRTWKIIQDALRWDRLFGGAGVLINVNENYERALNPDKIIKGGKLSFIPADRWELITQGLPSGLEYGMSDYNMKVPDFDYYGRRVHSSRVIRVVGEEAPSLARRRLQGWGMSVIECVLREINQYNKNQNVLFELLDEAKIDVYKLKDFNSKILSKFAQGKVVNRILLANMIKNFQNAIIIDAEDEYEQKQLTLAGVAETLEQIRIGIAAAVRMPLTKLFGLSQTGFSSGDDDRENYNTIVEHERTRAREVIDGILPLISRHLFGFEAKIEYEFKPLRILSAVDQENVLNSKFSRLSTLFSQGMLTDEEYARAIKEENILLMETEVAKGIRSAEPPMSSPGTWENPQQVMKPKKLTEET